MNGRRHGWIFLAALIFFIAYLVKINLNNEKSFKDKVVISHAYCHGSSHVDRRCTFKNICYKVDSGQFIFFNDVKSTYHGVPSDRGNPGFVSLSSISYHNQFLFDYVDVTGNQYETLSKKYLVEWLRGHTYLYGRFKPDNLMHVLHDDLFPLFYSIQVTKEEEEEEGKESRIFFFDQWSQNMKEKEKEKEDHLDCPVCYSAYKSLLQGKIVMNHFTWTREKLVCMDKVHVGVSRDTIWYDYGFYSPQKAVNHESIYLRETITRIFDKMNLLPYKCKLNPVIIIRRNITRIIVNFERIISLLTQFGLTYKIIDLENSNNFTQIIDSIKCARFLIGMHGSGLSLASFLPKGSGVLELFPYAIDPNKYTPYRTLCQRLDLQYDFWVNLKKENTLTYPDRPIELGGLKHLPLDERNNIETSNSVREHLCCSNSEWLFRINQDTIVDSDSFSQVLMSIVEKTKRNIEPIVLEETIRYPTPGPVESLKCTRKLKNGTISWNSPWNLQFLPSFSSSSTSTVTVDDTEGKGTTSVIYEVNIQSSVTGEKSVSYTPDTEMTVSLFSPQSFIWVRCIGKNAKGSYNSKAIIC